MVKTEEAMDWEVAKKGAEIDLKNQGGGKMNQDYMTTRLEQKAGLFPMKGLCLQATQPKSFYDSYLVIFPIYMACLISMPKKSLIL